MNLAAKLVACCTLALAATPARPADPEEKARAYFTDTALVDQDGRALRFYSDVLADRVVLIDFIFTRCKVACPLLTEKMNRVREAIGALYGKEVLFVSISVDPEFDTPVELTRFARRHGAPRDGWTWLGGKKEDVQLVLKRLGEWVESPDEHTTEFIAGNTRTRHWLKVRPDAPPEYAAEQLKRLVAESPSARTAAAAP